MTYKNLLFAIEDNVMILTINRPNALNAINTGVMSELNYFFGIEAPKRDDFAGVIITGAGDRAFAAGADITEFAGLSAQEGSNMSKYGHDTYFQIEQFKKPVIAVVNGFALGGGCELAMSCHMRIAEENAKFGQPEVNLGLIPGYGGTQRLVQFIGKAKAMELLLTADIFGAEDALTMGLVNYVEEKGQGIAKAKKIINKISTKGPLAVEKTIETVNAFFNEKIDGFKVEYDNFGFLIASEDSQEGARAFVEKRKAEFKGK